jgi:hypothetical protein
MKKELFDELLESVREGGAILRGEREPARRFTFEEPDVRDLLKRDEECCPAQVSAELDRHRQLVELLDQLDEEHGPVEEFLVAKYTRLLGAR